MKTSKVTKKISKESVKKAVAAYNRAVNKDNKAFEKMSPAEKRVQIARDVLFQLVSGKLIAAHRLWLGADEDDETSFISDSDIKRKVELQDILKKRKECYGCALGGMFMCAVERANKLKVNKMNFDHDSVSNTIAGNDVFDYMKKFFSKKQLMLIEVAFEGGEGAIGVEGVSSLTTLENDKLDYDDGMEAANFASMVNSPSEKMRLIMENIVVNKGSFRPNKKPTVITKVVTEGYNEAQLAQ